MATDPGAEEQVQGAQPSGDPEDLTPSERAELLEAEPSAISVIYTGQDFDVDGLVRRLRRDDILVPTFGHRDDRITSAGFQRSFVWTKPQMDRFIESLLLGFPIPGIFLVRQTDRRYLVLDGQQRLRTLRFFYEGVYEGKVFALNNVGGSFVDLTYATLPDELRRMLDNSFIQATIVDTDGSSASLDSIYQIFERLNSGGTQLTPHEIRVALYAGSFIDFLERLNNLDGWRALYGRKSPRLRDQELVLRILAFYVSAPTYRRPLKTFLNRFAYQHRDMSVLPETALADRFSTASRLLAASVGKAALRLQGYQINAALTEALFVGLMRRLDHGVPVDQHNVRTAVTAIRGDPEIEAAVNRATADEERVRTRLEKATAAFARA